MALSSAERSRRYYVKHREEVLATRKEYREAHPERVAENQRRARQRYGEVYRRTKFKKKYQLSDDEVDRLLSITKCQICGSEEALAIDHDHVTGRVRGRLCTNCNNGLGRFRDNVELLGKAIEYLK